MLQDFWELRVERCHHEWTDARCAKETDMEALLEQVLRALGSSLDGLGRFRKFFGSFRAFAVVLRVLKGVSGGS